MCVRPASVLVPRHRLRPVAGLRIRRLLVSLHPFEGGVDCHGVAMPEAVVLLEPANDFHSLDARLQQTFLFGKLLEVIGRFPCL